MSKTKKETRTIRECAAKWEFNDEDGKLDSKEIRVSYFSPTIAQLKAERLEEEKDRKTNPTGIVWLSDVLARSLHSLHDLPGDKSSIDSPSVEWLDEQDLKNLTAIRNAIDEDLKAGK